MTLWKVMQIYVYFDPNPVRENSDELGKVTRSKA